MRDYPDIAQKMIYLLSCAVNEKECDLKPDEIDFDGLYLLAKKHFVSSAVAFALESAGIRERRFEMDKLKAKRKIGLFDVEREKIYGRFNEAGIWFLPLKGIVMKDFYPRYGMREMSDNDILCDSSRMLDVKEIMESLGYKCESFDECHHDIYQKPPVLEFEMHRALFVEQEISAFDRYYENVFDRLIYKEGCEYAFSDEDLYIYMLAHEYMHFLNNGTGLRPLLDTYVYLKKHPDLDFDYIARELEKLELTTFERDSRNLAIKLFDLHQIGEDDMELLSILLDSTLYGSEERRDHNLLRRRIEGKDTASAKVKYLFDRVFLRGKNLEIKYPYFAEHKWLLPALYIYRPFMALFNHPKLIAKETKDVVKFKNKW